MLPGISSTLLGGQDPYTKLLCHFEGANGSTTTADSSPTQKGNATFAGNSSITTVISKFGSSCLLLQGAAYITFPNHADWEFGSGSFTIDWWQYRTNTGAAISRDFTTTYVPYLLSYNVGSGDLVYMSSTGSSWDIANGQSLGPNNYSTWVHKAVVRNGNTFYAFSGGVQQSTWSSSAALIANSNPLCIGAYASTNGFTGDIDELRISKGIARWTANFTPPTAPYV